MSTGYGSSVVAYRDRAAQIVRSGWATRRIGALSVAYVIHHILLIFFLPAAILIYWFGTGGILLDPNNAYISWDWWRIYGGVFALFLPAYGEYWLYQERKVAFATSTPAVMSFYNRTLVNVVWGIWLAMLLIIGAWIAFLAIWVGVADIASCSTSGVCSGTTSGAVSAGAIMLLVGMLVIAALCAALFLGALYVHSAARDAYAARIGSYAPIGSQIGAEVGEGGDDDAHALKQWASQYGHCEHGKLETDCSTCSPLLGHMSLIMETIASALPTSMQQQVYDMGVSSEPVSSPGDSIQL